MSTTILSDPPAAAPGGRTTGPTRRQVLAGAGILAGAGLLAACSTPARSGGGTTTTPAGGGAPGGAGGGSSGALAAVVDIPVGGAVSAQLDGKPIILSQAQAGRIVGLSAICTHQGCTVAPDGGRLLCPCHGSVYSLEGANVSGPAPSPLVPVEVHVDGALVLPGAG